MVIGAVVFSILFLLFIIFIKRKSIFKLIKKIHFKIDLTNSLEHELSKQSKKLEIIVVNKGINDINIRSLGLELFKLKIDILSSNKNLTNNELLCLNAEVDNIKQIISTNCFKTPKRLKFYLKDTNDHIYYTKSKNIKNFL